MNDAQIFLISLLALASFVAGWWSKGAEHALDTSGAVGLALSILFFGLPLTAALISLIKLVVAAL